MSLENAERLANLLQSNAANVSSSEWRPQQQDDANDLLIKGAEVAAAQETLNLSDEETIELLMREADAEDRGVMKSQRLDGMRERAKKKRNWDSKNKLYIQPKSEEGQPKKPREVRSYKTRAELERAVEKMLPPAFEDKTRDSVAGIINQTEEERHIFGPTETDIRNDRNDLRDRNDPLETRYIMDDDQYTEEEKDTLLYIEDERERRRQEVATEPLLKDLTPAVIPINQSPDGNYYVEEKGKYVRVPEKQIFRIEDRETGEVSTFYDQSGYVRVEPRGPFRRMIGQYERPTSKPVDQNPVGYNTGLSFEEAQQLKKDEYERGARLVQAELSARYSDPMVFDLASSILDGRGTVAVDTSGLEIVPEPYTSGFAADKAGAAVGAGSDGVLLQTQAPLDNLAGSNTPNSQQALNVPNDQSNEPLTTRVASMDADTGVKTLFENLVDTRVDISGTEQLLIQRLNGFGQQNNIDVSPFTTGPMTMEKFRAAIGMITDHQKKLNGGLIYRNRLSLSPGMGTALQEGLGLTGSEINNVASMLVAQEGARASGIDADSKARYNAGEGFRPAPRNISFGVNIHPGYKSGDMDSDTQVGGLEEESYLYTKDGKKLRAQKSAFGKKADGRLEAVGEGPADKSTKANLIGAVKGEGAAPVKRRRKRGEARNTVDLQLFYDSKRDQDGNLSEPAQRNFDRDYESLLALEKAERAREEGTAITPRPPRSGPTVTGPASQATEARERYETLHGPASDDMANRELVREIKSRRRR